MKIPPEALFHMAQAITIVYPEVGVALGVLRTIQKSHGEEPEAARLERFKVELAKIEAAHAEVDRMVDEALEGK